MALSILHFSKIVALPSAIFSLWHNISAVGLVYCWKKNKIKFESIHNYEIIISGSPIKNGRVLNSSQILEIFFM